MAEPGIERIVAGFNEAYALDRSIAPPITARIPQSPDSGIMEAITIEAATPGQSVTVLERIGLKRSQPYSRSRSGPSGHWLSLRLGPLGGMVFFRAIPRSHSISDRRQGADLLIHEGDGQAVMMTMHDAAALHGNERIARIMTDIHLDYHASRAIGRDGGGQR